MPGRSCVAYFHTQAALDLETIRDRAERASIHRAVAMLSQNGHRMAMPHARKITGADGICELRPKSGRSRWRPLYAAADDGLFVVLVIAPEARVDGNGFRRAVEKAQKLMAELQAVLV